MAGTLIAESIRLCTLQMAPQSPEACCYLNANRSYGEGSPLLICITRCSPWNIFGTQPKAGNVPVEQYRPNPEWMKSQNGAHQTNAPFIPAIYPKIRKFSTNRFFARTLPPLWTLPRKPSLIGLLDPCSATRQTLSTDWRGSPQLRRLSAKGAALLWIAMGKILGLVNQKAELVRRPQPSTWPPALLSRASRFYWWTAIPRQTAPRGLDFSATTTADPSTTC